MSVITSIETRSLMEAYQAVYSSELREQLEEEREVQKVGIQIIENAAYVLFSQGYDVDDVISYFTEAETDVIVEDFVNFSEGNLILESVNASDEYIAEQFEILYERAGILQGAKAFIGRGINAVKNFASGAQKSANLAQWKKGSLATPMGPAAKKPGFLQKAGDFAKGVMNKAKDVAKKIPGAPTLSKIVKSPVGKLAGKALPGLGAAAYGIDAADRLKKGDWGGAALSGIGAVTSAIPGAGLVGGLVPGAIQMATDKMGLTGDKSKKGAKIVGPKIVGPKIVGPKNAAPAAPAASSSTPAPSSTPAKPKITPSKPSTTDTKPTPMQQWAKANPKLADKVKLGQSGYGEISATRTKPGPNEKQNQSPTTGPTTTPEKDKDFSKQAGDSVKAYQEREKNSTTTPPPNSALAKELQKRKREAEANKQPVNSSYEYDDAYDLVLEYLLSQGHVDTVDEAHYVMLEMDAEVIQDIVEERRDPRGRVSSGPMNVYRDSKRKPDKEHSDAVKSYDNEQKKKTPEQKKAELDAYIERQRNR